MYLNVNLPKLDINYLIDIKFTKVNIVEFNFPHLLTKLTPDKVLQGMETIHIHDVYDWSKEVFGQSMLSKRKLAFSTDKNYIKVA